MKRSLFYIATDNKQCIVYISEENRKFPKTRFNG